MYSNVKNFTNEVLVGMYQEAETKRMKDDLLEVLLHRMEGIIKQKCFSFQNIKNTTYEDRYSILCMAFVRCLDTFDVSKGYKLTTWSSCYFKKSMVKLHEHATRQKRGDGEDSSYEAMCELGHEGESTDTLTFSAECGEFSNIEFLESLQEIGLTEKELTTCKLILAGVERKEVAERLGVSQVSIFNYLKSVGKKMQGAGFAGAF